MAWTHPRLSCFVATRNWPAFAQEAMAALARRQADYPAAVERGALTSEAAEADIAAWRIIAESWQWIASKGAEGRCSAHGGNRAARIAALDTAIDRFFARLDAAAQHSGKPPAAAITVKQDQQLYALANLRFWASEEIDAPGTHPARELHRHRAHQKEAA